MNQSLVGIVEKLDQYWQNLKEERKIQKEQNVIQSKFLKKLKEENQESTRIPIENFESLCECLLRLVQIFSDKHNDTLTKYMTKENNQFINTLLTIVSFPKERVVNDSMGVIQRLLEKTGNQLAQFFQTSEIAMEKVGRRLVNMYKLNYATKEFEEKLSETVIKSYCLVKEEEKDAYTALILTRIQKILLKMMVHFEN